MKIQATVRKVEHNTLYVYDHTMLQITVVHTPDACRFHVGDLVCIQYSGAMTMSIPPQVTATSISILPGGPSRHNGC